MERPSRKVRIRVEYKVAYQNPIQVTAGESVELGRADDDYPGWLWCRAADGREGWMPVELLSRTGALAMVLKDYSAKESLRVRAALARTTWPLAGWRIRSACRFVPRSSALRSTRPLDPATDLVAQCKRWLNAGWTQLPMAKLYGEYELVRLLDLIPSLASRCR